MDLFALFVLLVIASAANAASVTKTSQRNVSEIRQFNNTTAFTKVVPSSDLSERDAIFVTPSLMFVGKSNGDILRCLVSDPSVCELFYSYSSSSWVTGMVVSGEYLYASLANGVLLKCKLHEKSCTTGHTASSPMYCLVAAGGYIHAGLQDGRMLRCGLKDNSCKTFNQFAHRVASLGATEKYIYAGLDDNHNNLEIWRCSITSENSCRVFLKNNTYSKMEDLFAVGETVYYISKGGTLFNCTRGNPCKFTLHRDGTNMAVFDRSLYIMHNSNISICEWGVNTCTFYDQNEGALSIAFAYSTYNMQERYLNEEKTCLSSTSRCPPFMSYYEISERPMLEVYVKDGKLYNSQGILVDTRNADVGHSGQAAIFAMGPDGQILLSNVHNTVLRTSSLFAGQPVSGAGEIVVEDGVIKSMRACSDHYQADARLNEQVITVLNMKGYKERIESLPCCRVNECGQAEENTVADVQ